MVAATDKWMPDKLQVVWPQIAGAAGPFPAGSLLRVKRKAKSEQRSALYELLFTASFPDLAKTISDTNRMAPITMALSATLKAGQW